MGAGNHDPGPGWVLGTRIRAPDGCWGPGSGPRGHRRVGTRDVQGNAARHGTKRAHGSQAAPSAPAGWLRAQRGRGTRGTQRQPGGMRRARLNHPEKAPCQLVLPAPRGGTGGTQGSSGGSIRRENWAKRGWDRGVLSAEAVVQPRKARLEPKTSPSSPAGHGLRPSKTHSPLSEDLFSRCWAAATREAQPMRRHRGFRSKTTNSQDMFFCANKDLDLPAAAGSPGWLGVCRRLWTSPKPIPRGSKEGAGAPQPGSPPAASPRWPGSRPSKARRGEGDAGALPSASQRPHPTAGERDGEGSGGRGGEETAMGQPRVQVLLTEGPRQRRRNHRRCPRALLQPRASGWRAARTRRTLSLTAARVPKHAEGYRSEPLGQLQHGHVRGGQRGRGLPCPVCPSKGRAASQQAPKSQRGAQPLQHSPDPRVIPRSRSWQRGC